MLKYLFIVIPIVSVILYSCSKDDREAALPSDEELLTQRIEDIIPPRFLDSLKKLGLEVYTGVNPPNVEGTYFVSPHVLDTSSVETDVIGRLFLDAKLELSEQSRDDFGIKFISEHVLGNADTSIATAISGSGNAFTIYGKAKATINSYSAVFAIILSAIKEGDDLKDLRVGLVNIDNSQGGDGVFIDEGEGRINYDSDGISEKISSVQAISTGISSADGSPGGGITSGKGLQQQYNADTDQTDIHIREK